jgi:hypothetical protein
MREIQNQFLSFKSRQVSLWLILLSIFCISVLIVSGITVDPSKTPHKGTVLHVDGFKESKVIGYSNGRYLVVLSDAAGHSKIEQWSLETVQQFMTK